MLRNPKSSGLPPVITKTWLTMYSKYRFCYSTYLGTKNTENWGKIKYLYNVVVHECLLKEKWSTRKNWQPLDCNNNRIVQVFSQQISAQKKLQGRFEIKCSTKIVTSQFSGLVLGFWSRGCLVAIWWA